jgi:hypothetical protein
VKIKYVRAADPTLNGTETHIPNNVAAVLIATGAAVEVKLPRRSAPGWAEARAAQSREFTQGPSQYDTVVDFVVGIQYSISTQRFTGAPIIVRKTGTETASIVSVEQAKACKVPKEIIQQLKNAIEAKKNTAAADAKERNRALAAQEQEQLRVLNG